VVCVNSCTNALLLALEWNVQNFPWLCDDNDIRIPKNTYVSVPMVIRRCNLNIFFSKTKRPWKGVYQLWPGPVWDYACRFTSDMYSDGQFQCVSFAANKILGMEQGGAILHDNNEADKWFRRMRFDGRTEGVDPKDDTFDLIGHHCPMLPSVAAQGILRLHHLPKHNEDLKFQYPDLSQHPAFK